MLNPDPLAVRYIGRFCFTTSGLKDQAHSVILHAMMRVKKFKIHESETTYFDRCVLSTTSRHLLLYVAFFRDRRSSHLE